MDYPQAWAFVHTTIPEEHHPNCSWRTQTGALLCDCDVIWDEYVRRGGTDPRDATSRIRTTREFPGSPQWVADHQSSAGECSTCGKYVEKRYGGEGRYLLECIDCWTRAATSHEVPNA